MRVACSHCKATFYSNKEYSNRPTCMEPLCPLQPSDGAQGACKGGCGEEEHQQGADMIPIDRVKVRQVIDAALEAAARKDPLPEMSHPNAPVNLHSMPTPPHDPYCSCTVCWDKRQQRRGHPPMTPRSTVAATAEQQNAAAAATTVVRQPQAKIHVRIEEQAVSSKTVADEENLYVEVPKAIFIHIRPKKRK